MDADLAVVIVSTNEARWLPPCLSSVFAHAGDISLDVVIADNDSVDGTRELVESDFPGARVVTCRNHGFGHANNRGLEATSSRYVLFLNPDTEIMAGTFADLIARLDRNDEIGLVGVKQLAGDGELFPTIRRFPSLSRYLFESLASDRKFPLRASWLGERELDMTVYEREVSCDWTSGPSCSRAGKLSTRRAVSTSGSSSSRKKWISAGGSVGRAGTFGIFPP